MDREKAWKLLLVEDDRDSAEALIALLALYDIKTLWAIDGPSALLALDSIQRLSEQPPDFVLLDVNLPGTDTVLLGRGLMSHEVGAPVVLVSASSPQVLESTAREIGAVASLRKPFSMECLVTILRQHEAGEHGPVNLRVATPQ